MEFACLLKTLKKNQLARLPIQSIDGVSTDVLISRDNEGKVLIIHIRSTWSVGYDVYSSRYSLYQKTVSSQEQLDTLFTDIIPTLKYNKLRNKLYEPEDKFTHHLCCLALASKVKDTSNKIKLDWENCCVCHDDTICQTSCGHFLCLECDNKLKKKRCPICRNKQYNFFEEECYDDSDSDDEE